MTKIKYKLTVYEYERDYQIYTGTTGEITEQTGVAQQTVAHKGIKVGTRWAKLKCVDNVSGGVVYGTIEDIAKLIGSQTSYVTSIVRGTRNTKRYTITFTGQYITELYNDVKPGVVKPKTDYTSIKAVHTVKPVKMSAYWKEVFYSQFKGW